MAARILDGKATARAVRAELGERTAALTARGVRPGLAVVLAGEDPASRVYVRNKDRAASEVGFEVRTVELPAAVSERELLGAVHELNGDPAVHGILVQLPLPRAEGRADLDAERVIEAIDPAKDVDGLTAASAGLLVTGGEGLAPCTPAGCLELCDRHGIELSGARVVVLGRSRLVGKPLALLALARHATVTVCHSRTRDLPEVCREADVLVAAVGRPRMVRGDWIRPGAVVIDVGINRLEDGSLAGDVDFDEAVERAAWITPVPGGVGPMTIAMLLRNTLVAAARRAGVTWDELGRRGGAA